MKIKLQDLVLDEPFALTVAGDETWLEKIYQSFPVPAGASQPRLSGEFVVLRLAEDYVQLQGSFSYTPYVACSRCNVPILWPLEGKVDICYFPEAPAAFAGERALRADELEEYYLEDGEVDLELALNEAVVLAVPTRTIPEKNQQHECQVCFTNLDSDCVYSTDGERSQNPFARLKQLKLDD